MLLLVSSRGFLFHLLDIVESNETSENSTGILKKTGSNELGGFWHLKETFYSILTTIVFFQEASTWKGSFEGNSGNSNESNLDFMIQVVFLIMLI